MSIDVAPPHAEDDEVTLAVGAVTYYPLLGSSINHWLPYLLASLGDGGEHGDISRVGLKRQFIGGQGVR